MVILISDAFDKTLPTKLTPFGDVTDDKGRLADAEVVLVRSKTKVTREYIDSAPKLKLVVRGGVGMDNIDLEYCRERGITALNTAEASTTAVAELAFALMIAVANSITQADASMREGKWLKKELKRQELWGKTLGILGMGRIGSALALRARAFRMHCLAWHPATRFSDFAEIRSDLDSVLRDSDFLSLNMPLVDSTRGIINSDSIARMKDGAIIINTGRGGLVVEEDVAAALQSGKLGGYGTDVWHQEPPNGSPILSAPHTVCLPHLGASTRENMLRIGEIIENIIKEYRDGK